MIMPSSFKPIRQVESDPFVENHTKSPSIITYQSGKMPNVRELKMLRARLIRRLRLINSTISMIEKGDIDVDYENELFEIRIAKNHYISSQVRPSSVYLMHDPLTKLSKIGSSRDLEQRLFTLKHDKPLIELIISIRGGLKEERLMQKKFAQYQVRGEWFMFTRPMIEIVSQFSLP